MPKAFSGSRVSARLNTPSAEGVGEDALLGGHTEGEAALEAVGELNEKFEEWHLQAKKDAADAKAASVARPPNSAHWHRRSWIFGETIDWKAKAGN